MPLTSEDFHEFTVGITHLVICGLPLSPIPWWLEEEECLTSAPVNTQYISADVLYYFGFITTGMELCSSDLTVRNEKLLLNPLSTVIHEAKRPSLYYMMPNPEAVKWLPGQLKHCTNFDHRLSRVLLVYTSDESHRPSQNLLIRLLLLLLAGPLGELSKHPRHDTAFLL